MVTGPRRATVTGHLDRRAKIRGGVASDRPRDADMIIDHGPKGVNRDRKSPLGHDQREETTN